MPNQRLGSEAGSHAATGIARLAHPDTPRHAGQHPPTRLEAVHALAHGDILLMGEQVLRVELPRAGL
jgi:hypothetical protein